MGLGIDPSGCILSEIYDLMRGISLALVVSSDSDALRSCFPFWLPWNV